MNEESFEFTKQELLAANLKIVEAEYSPESFGGWHIVIRSKPDIRILWDGKEQWLVVEEKTKRKDHWDFFVWKGLWIACNANNDDLLAGIEKVLQQT